MKIRLVSFAIMSALALSACSGGGTKPNLPPTDPTTTPPPAPPAPPPAPPAPPAPPPAPPVTYSYPEYNHLVPTGALAAQAKGFDGTGVKIGVMDSGIDPTLQAFEGRVAWFKSYNADGSNEINENTGHGSTITEAMAGSPSPTFVGGIASGADLYIAQICDAASMCTPYAEAYTDLAAQGVKLFNQSFGLPSNTGHDEGEAYTYMTHQPLVDAGSLFVWSAGNDGADHANLSALLPLKHPDLQKGWLMAINVDVDGDGNVTTIADNSGACGLAADWCLAAPGTAMSDPVGTKFTTGLAKGTSGSAAVVTGIAAQVWQAFPWMSGTNVQQTLLTTATPMGPSDVYGWGLVNAEKAVDGPAQFAFGAFEADMAGYDSTFLNDISGSGSLVLSGAGSLELAGKNTYKGGTQITDGTLILSGSLGSEVSISSHGTFVGDGTVNANVANAGLLSSRSETDGKGLTIAGDYTAVAGAVTGIAIGNPITVGGTANLDGTLRILAPSDTYKVSSTETLLSADAVVGSFDDKTFGSDVFYTAVLHYTPTSLTADVARASVAQSVPLANPAMASTANGIESALQLADKWSQDSYAEHAPFLNKAAAFLSAHTQAEAQASIQSLDGEIYATTGAIEAQQSRVVDDALAIRQNAVIHAEGGSVWVQALSASGSLFAPGFSSARYHANGVLLGGELPLSEKFTGGIAFGRHYMDAALAGLSGRVKGKEDTAAIYAHFAFDGGAYLAGRASWSHERLEVTRSALIGGALNPLASNRTDGIGRVTVESGKTVTLGRDTTLTPYLSLSAVRINQAAFAEHGADGFGLVAGSHRQSATQTDLGLRLAHGFDWSGGHSLLTGYAAYRRVLSGANLDFTAALVGAPDATFQVLGQDVARHTGQVGINFTTQMNDQWNWFVNADAQAARGRSRGLSANAGVRLRF